MERGRTRVPVVCGGAREEGRSEPDTAEWLSRVGQVGMSKWAVGLVVGLLVANGWVEDAAGWGL